MAKFSINQASKETGKSTSVIHKAVKEGRLSAEKTVNKAGTRTTYQIDASELFRVFPKKVETKETEHLNFNSELLEANAQIKVLEALIEELRDDKAYLKNELSKSLDTNKQITNQMKPKKFFGIF